MPLTASLSSKECVFRMAPKFYMLIRSLITVPHIATALTSPHSSSPNPSMVHSHSGLWLSFIWTCHALFRLFFRESMVTTSVPPLFSSQKKKPSLPTLTETAHTPPNTYSLNLHLPLCLSTLDLTLSI